MSKKEIDVGAHTFRSPDFEGVVKKAVDFLTHTPEHPLPPSGHFPGAGVYVIYYSGDFEYYGKISKLNRTKCKQAIYIGKAVPAGWRTARARADNNSQSLYNRLREHKQSIEQGEGLHVTDFKCQFMILLGIEADLISSVEAQLIRDYKPVWNMLVDGFGNHDPGSGRYNQARSEWDVLHPGRPWADRLTGEPSPYEDVTKKLRDYF